MAKLKNIHHGEVLLKEFLIPFNISAYKLAKDIGIPQTLKSVPFFRVMLPSKNDLSPLKQSG